MHTYTHTHTVLTGSGEGQCCLTGIFGEKKCRLEFAFEAGESSRVPDTLGNKRVNLSVGVSLYCGIRHSLTLGPGLYNPVANRYYGPQPPSLSFLNPKARHVQPCCKHILQTSTLKSVIL